jgi:hypothetical protein
MNVDCSDAEFEIATLQLWFLERGSQFVKEHYIPRLLAVSNRPVERSGLDPAVFDHAQGESDDDDVVEIEVEQELTPVLQWIAAQQGGFFEANRGSVNSLERPAPGNVND